KLCKRTGGKRVRNAEHPNQDVLVSHRTITGLVDRAVKRQLQTRRDAADTTARLIEHASANLPAGPATERLFQLFAHLLEVDPQLRERVRVDARRPDSGQERGVRDVRAGDAELAENPRRTTLRITGQREQQVFRADVAG